MVLENRDHLSLVVAGETRADLDLRTGRLARWLSLHPEADTASVAARLAAGATRHALPWRRVVVLDDPRRIVERLTRLETSHVVDGHAPEGARPRVVFVAPGFGGLRPGSGARLYRQEPVFREVLDRAANALQARTGIDLCAVLFPAPEAEEEAAARLARPVPGHVAQAILSIALGALWRDRGIEPDALLGHSVGEYAAATLAGALDLEAAVAMLVARGRLMARTPPGAMLAVVAPADEVEPWLVPGARIAGRLSPRQCLVSGSAEGVERSAESLRARGIEHRRLAVDRGYHSHMMDPVVEPFAREVADLPGRGALRVPYVSMVTGDWARPEEASSPAHWARHLRTPVHFQDALERILAQGPALFLELGSGAGTLRWIAERLETEPEEARERHPVVASLAHPSSPEPESLVLARATARLWVAGAEVAWDRIVGAGEPDPELFAAELDPLPVTHVAEPVAEGTAADVLVLWRELLGGARPLSAGDDFFAAGGDSLLATRMLLEVERRYGVAIPLTRFLRTPTAAGLAGRIEREGDGAEGAQGEAAPLPPLEPVAADAEPALSFGQEQLWLTEQSTGASAAYGVPTLLAFDGPLDPARLAAAATAVVARHETLRSRYPALDGRPSVHTDSAFSPPLPVVDVSGLAGPRRAATRAIRAVVARPFDLGRGVLRQLLVRLAPEEHRYLLDVHHIAFDGWSRSIVLADLAEAYRGASRPTPALRYADFAAWKRRVLDEGRLAPHLAYWRERLDGVEELSLPADRRPGAAPDFRGGRVPVPWSPDATDGLQRLATGGGVTLFTVLLALFQGLLQRLTGDDDVTVGSPVAGRERPETAEMVGYFVDMLALRTRVDPSAGIRPLLASCRRTVFDAYEHREAPFERVVAELAPDRAPGRNPLFQSVLVLQGGTAAPELPELRTRILDLHNGTAKFDLVLQAEMRGKRLHAFLEYSRERFDATTADRIARQLARFADGALAAPEAPLDRLPLLGPAERHQVALEWNDVPGTRPNDFVPVHRRFLDRCRLQPDAVALWAGDAGWTGRAAARRASVLARRLRGLGVGRGSRVLLWLDRSPELPVAALAVLATGAAYVPVDPAAPDERVRFVLADCGARVVVTDPTRAHKLEGEAAVVSVPGRSEAGAEPEDLEAGTVADPLDAAYVIYTSGSTGTPKGVEVTHGGLANLVRWHGRVHGIGAGDRATLLANPSFDASVWDLWSAWSHGAALVVVPPETVADPERLADWLAGERITTCFLPTPLADALLGLAPAPPLPPRVLTGGDALHRRPPLGSRTTWINHYGPSEDSVVSTWGVVAPRADGRPPSIGRPVDGHRARVADPHLASLPIGVPGELVLSGLGLARGYPGRPGMTAERFVPDPEGRSPGARCYRTGDRTRLRPDGRIDFVGRLDRQVKVRGFRIEPDEIEAALAAAEGVAEGAVRVLDGPGGRRLVGYYTASGDPPPDAESVRRSLRRRLPAYMVPARLVRLETLPRTPSGKIDRAALPDPSPARGDAGRPLEGPVETALGELWREVLEAPAVDATSDFFELGGHSLLASRLASRIAHRFGVDAALPFVLEHSRLCDQAEALTRGLEDRVAPRSAPSIPPRNDRSVAPLSFAQEQVWIVERLRSAGSLYNVPRAFRLTGDLDAERLRASLEAVVARHEALRSRVRWPGPGGSPRAEIVEASEPAWSEADLSDLSGPDREREARRRLEEVAARPFDLERGPLVRALLLRVAPRDHRFCLVFHHLVCDGASLDVVLEELDRLYAAGGDPARAGLEPVAPTFGDFAAWQRESWRGERLERELSWWRDRLAAPLPPPALPYDRPGAMGEERAGALVDRWVPEPSVAALRELVRDRRTTLFSALAALFAAFLARIGEEDEVLFATASAQRDQPETERLVGHFVNLVPLRLRAEGSLSFGELLERARRELVETLRHGELPLSRVVEVVGGEERGESNALVRQTLIFHPEAPRSAVLGDLGVESLEIPRRTAKFDLGLELWPTADGRLACRWEYATDLFDRTSVLRLAGRLERLLADVVAAPDRPLARHHSLAPAERHQVLTEWSGDGAGPAGDLVSRLEERFADGPDRIAVDDGGLTLSYAALDRRSARLAAWLVDAGLEPGSPVGVRAERSAETVVAICAVLRAGGCYVPLDPGYPEERLRWMLEDSGARIVLPADGPASDLGARPSPARFRSPDSPAYVMYTSGSTGRPKGVEVPDRAILRLIDARRHGGLHRETSTLLFAPLAFDASTLELWGALAMGGRVVVAPRGTPELGELVQHAERRRVTCLWLTAALFHRLGPDDLAHLRGLEVFLSGGDVLLRERVADALRVLPETLLVDGYGPTENTTFTACHAMARLEDVGPAGRPVSIGRPIEGTTVVLLDRFLRPAPIGAPAELHAGGAGLADGYRGRPALTAERFVPDPTGATPGARLYRTGDFARWLADGRLEFLGRRDGQVKVRGHRVEIGEVDAALADLPGVTEAAAVVRDRSGGGELVAFYVASGEAPSADALRDALRRRLPEPMVPGRLVPLDALPVNANGKVDRRALAELAESGVGATGVNPGSGDAPATALERVLAGLWADVLNVDGVSMSTDFFRAGGHSLGAIDLAERVRATLGAPAPLALLFDHPTLSGYVHHLSEESGGRAALEAAAEMVERVTGLSDDEIEELLLGSVDPETVPGADRARTT